MGICDFMTLGNTQHTEITQNQKWTILGELFKAIWKWLNIHISCFISIINTLGS